MLPPKKGKRCNNPQSPFLWLCSARLCLLQFFIFFRWQLLNKQKHNQLTIVSSAIQLIRNKACRKKETIRHKDAPGCRARAPSRSSASFPGNDSGIPTFPCRSSCSTTDLTRRCAADSAAPSGPAWSPCRTGWTRCLRKTTQHWWQYCVGANDAFGNFGMKNRCGSGKTYRCVSVARISFLSNARIGGAILIVRVTLLRSKRVHVDAMLSWHWKFSFRETTFKNNNAGLLLSMALTSSEIECELGDHVWQRHPNHVWQRHPNRAWQRQN